MKIMPRLLSATALALIPLTASAQQATPAAQSTEPASSMSHASATANPVPGDIIVTARRRQESVLKVPVVMAVIDALTLQRNEITDIQGLTTKVPGLIIGQSVGTVGPQISLRGIGTSALDAGIDQSVSLNIDGQQFSQGYAFTSGLFDLAQAEVLKGPQALFFGKNSPGGVIALTTADPGNHLEIIGRASYEFESLEKHGELIVSTPLTDTLGVRLAGSWSDSDGYFYNTAKAVPGLGGIDPNSNRYGGNENYIIRGTVVWKPAPNFRVRLKVNATKDSSRNQAGELQFVSCPNGSGPGFLGLQFIGGCKEDRNYELVGLDPKSFSGNFANGTPALQNGGIPFERIIQNFGTLELDYNARDFSITSTSTYYHDFTDAMINGTMAGAAGPTLFAANLFRRRDITQEVRVESTTHSSFNWLLGGYYQDGNMTNDVYVGGNQALGLPASLTAGTHDVRIRSASAFGQLRWKPVEQLELAVGARYTHETRSDDAFTFDPVSQGYLPVLLPIPRLLSKNVAPEATITYTPTDLLTVFAAYKTGFKSGSFSITTPATSGVNNSFGDEKVKGGEFGLKTRSQDRSFNANLAFYYYRYNGLQVGVSQTAATNVPELFTLNAGAARTFGIDFDTSYRPPSIPDLAFNLAVNWNKAKYLNLQNVPCYGGQTIALGCNEQFNATATSALIPGQTGYYTAQNASGEPLEHAPVWQLNGGFDYELPLNKQLRLAFGGSAQYSSRYKTVIGPREDYYQAGYGKVNAYVTLKQADDRWELSLIGNNIGNTLRAGYCAASDGQDSVVFGRFTEVTGGATNPTGKVDDVECAVDAGRQVFLRLTVHIEGAPR